MEMKRGKYEVQFMIPGVPVAKGRPRFRKLGSFVQTYTPAKTRNAEKEIVNCFKQQVIDFKMPENGPISLCIMFYMPIPKGTSKKRTKEILEQHTPHTKKPDVDNLTKLVQDALNGIAWHDDSEICDIHVTKIYGQDPSTFVSIAYL